MKKLLFVIVLFAAGCTTNVKPEQPNPQPILPGEAVATFQSKGETVKIFNEWIYNEQGYVKKYFQLKDKERALAEYRNVISLNGGDAQYEQMRTIKPFLNLFAQDRLFAYQLVEMPAKPLPHIYINIIPRYTGNKK
jgi:hypothetical protein